MSSVDDRIVNMKFNNSQFTSGVDKSKRDLTGLEQTITKAGTSKGMTQFGAGADAVKAKFSALQVVGVTALATITNKAVSAGLSMVKKLTIQPLIDGFKEYTTNLNSIQTIMANTGKGVKEVNKYLDEMNKYSDQTIYNFSEMAKNVGTFTAAGVELPRAASAIKGIANLAALSGSNSHQAGTAMYQLSQAISAGRVGLQDWNSVVNAGMGGKVFKNALAQTAVAMGDLSKNAVKVGTDVTVMGNSFRQSIAAKPGSVSWLSSDVLVTTLATLDGRFSETAIKAGLMAKGMNEAEAAGIAEKRMAQSRIDLAKEGVDYSEKEYKAMVKKADAAYEAATQIKTATQLFQVVQESIGSMWSGAFRLILGNFNQSKKLWGNVGDVVLGIVSTISNRFLGALKIWSREGGRNAVIDGFSNAFSSLLKVLKRVTRAFGQVFPPNAGDSLVSLSKAFESFTKNLMPSRDTLFDIRRIFTGVFAVLHIGVSIVTGIAKAFGAFFGALFEGSGQARGGIFELLGDLGHVLKRFDMWLTKGGRLTDFLAGIGKTAGTALKPVVAAIGFVISAFASLISGEGIGGVMEAFDRAKGVIVGFVGDLIQGFDNITAPFDGLKSDIADFAGRASEPFQNIIDTIERVRLKIVEGLGLDTITPDLDGLRTLVDRVKNSFVTFAEGLRHPSVMMEDLGNKAEWVVSKLKTMFDSIQKSAGNLDISNKLSAARDAITNFFSGIDFSVGDLASQGAEIGQQVLAGIISGLRTAGPVLWQAISDAAIGIVDGFKSVLGIHSPATAMIPIGVNIMLGIGKGIVNAAKSVFGFLSDAVGWVVDKLSSIPFPNDALEWASLLNGLLSLALIKRLFLSRGILSTLKDSIRDIGNAVQSSFGELTNTLKIMQGSIRAEMIKNIALGVALLVASLVVLSFVPMDKLKQGLAGLSAVMTLLAVAMKVMLSSLGGMKYKELTAQTGAMVALGAAMVLMATAVAILVAAVAALGYLPVDVLKQGLAGLAAVMTALIAAMLGLSGIKGKLTSAGVAMVLAATAISILVGAIVVLGKIPIEVLQQGLTGLAAGLTILTVAMLLLSGIAGRIVGAGIAMALMAVALDLVVGSIIALGSIDIATLTQGLDGLQRVLLMMTLSLLALSIAGPGIMGAGAAMIMLSGALLIMAGVIAFLGALPMEVISRGLYAMAAGLAILLVSALLAETVIPGMTALSILIGAIGAAMLATGTGFFLFAAGLALIAAVGTAAFAVITIAIGAFIALLPMIAVQMAAAFVSFLQALALAAPKIRKAMGVILEGLLGTINDAIPKLMQTFRLLVEAGLEVIATYISRFVLLGIAIVLAILQGLRDNIPKMIDAAYEIAYAFIDGMGKRAVDLANAGADALIEMLNGLSEAVRTKGPLIREAMGNLAHALKDEFVAAMEDLFGDISITDFIPQGVLDVAGDIGNALGFRQNIKNTKPGKGGYTLGPQDAEKKQKQVFNPLEGFSQKIQDAAHAMVDELKTLSASLGTFTSMVGASAKQMQLAATYQATVAETRTTAAATATETANTSFDKAEGQLQTAKDMKKKNPKRAKAIKKANAAITAAEAARKAARKQQAAADATAAKAELAQIKADFESQKERDAIQFKKDPGGLGDAKAQISQDLSTQSAQLAAQAQARSDEAARLDTMAKNDKKNAKKYHDQARELRKQAAAETSQSLLLAAQSIEAQAAAVAAYAQARRLAAQDAIKSMADIREQQAADAAQRKWEEDFAKADDATKKVMLSAREAENQRKADAAQAELTRQLAIGDALAAKLVADPNYAPTEAELLAAQQAAEEAARQAAIVTAALDAVKQDQDSLNQLISQVAQNNTSTGGSTTSTTITPSRTALEDAAKAVDRFTSSVQQSEEMAGATASTTQFVQNNYSPEALSASTIYRQSKNLIAAAEVKMAV